MRSGPPTLRSDLPRWVRTSPDLAGSLQDLRRTSPLGFDWPHLSVTPPFLYSLTVSVALRSLQTFNACCVAINAISFWQCQAIFCPISYQLLSFPSLTFEPESPWKYRWLWLYRLGQPFLFILLLISPLWLHWQALGPPPKLSGSPLLSVGPLPASS